MGDKMREEFEYWWVSVRLRKQPEKFLNGDYCAPSVYNAWVAWQASRAALVVELPKKFDRTGDLHFCFDGYETIEAIHAAGVKTK